MSLNKIVLEASILVVFVAEQTQTSNGSNNGSNCVNCNGTIRNWRRNCSWNYYIRKYE